MLYDVSKAPKNAGDARSRGPRGSDRKRSITAAIDSMKGWCSSADGIGGGLSSLSTAGVFQPSIKGTIAISQARCEELQDSESAVTCICFGLERLLRAYVLFATASKDGTVVNFRCYRKGMEVAMFRRSA